MPVEIKTNPATISVFGAHLVGQKIIEILNYAIENECDTDIGIHSIVFRDDGKPYLNNEDNSTMWMCLPDSKSIVCNLKNCISHTIRESLAHKKEHFDVGLKGLIWHSILAGGFHEMFHAQSFMVDEHGDQLYSAIKATKRTKDIKKFLDKEEDRADEYAEQMLFTLAKKIDLEMDFGPNLDNLVNKEIDIAIAGAEKH